MRSLVRKPWAWFIPGPNVRQAVDAEAKGRLLQSMQQHGLLIPFIARPQGDKGVLIDGLTRWGLMPEAGIKEADVLITDEEWSQFKTDVFQLANAIHRQSVSPCDQYKTFHRWKEDDESLTNQAIADLVNLDASEVSRICSLSKGIEAVQKAASEGRIGPSTWPIITSQPPERQQALLALHLRGVSREALRRAASKPDVPEEAREQSAKLRRIRVPVPGFKKSVIIESQADMGLGDYVDVVTELLKLAKKSASDGLDISTFIAVLKDRSKQR